MSTPSSPAEPLAAAMEDQDSVIELTRQLVRVPSRGGIDPYDPVLGIVRAWLLERSLPVTVLTDPSGAAVGLSCEIGGECAGPRWVLDACLDTAPFGDESAWTHPPAAAHIKDGWMWGRGTSDSKVGAAIFCHIATRMAPLAERLRGRLVLLFDVDEHTGRFGGAKRYFEGPGAPADVAGVMIGYPGLDTLVVGGRGVFRARLRVHGVPSHSGGAHATPNAIEKTAQLVLAVTGAPLPGRMTEDFPLPARLTVSTIHGGEGYSVTPDVCVLGVDMRTTPALGWRAFHDILGQMIHAVDQAWPGTRPTTMDIDTEWPPYHTGATSPIRHTLLDAARSLGIDARPEISGMSNIGNYLAGLNIPATAGFGVIHEGLHAIDERIRLDTIPVVQATYHTAVLTLSR
ncbi:MAG TPA: M20/M25/M40 family metallo-hydrolase, partial [Pseudonocardiaceae bacterium]|nr:M20/M25/M40 family metallo-hydrolase [Pseudonocardiaceae bacterium]